MNSNVLDIHLITKFTKLIIAQKFEPIKRFLASAPENFDPNYKLSDYLPHEVDKPEYNVSPLQYLLKEDRTSTNKIAEYLIKFGNARVNYKLKNAKESMAIQSTVIARNLDGLIILLDNKANPNPRVPVEEQPLYYLKQLYDKKINRTAVLLMTEELIMYGANTSIIANSSLLNTYAANSNAPHLQWIFLNAVLDNKTQKVEKICERPHKGFDINYVFPDGTQQNYTTLQLSLHDNKLNSTSNYLITNCSANIDAQTGPGITALTTAISSLNLDGIDILLSHKVNINPNVTSLYQPLEQLRIMFHHARHEGYNKTVIMSITKKLIDHGANTSIINDDSSFMKAYHSYLNPDSNSSLTTEQSTIPDLTTLSPEEAKKQLNNMTDYFLTTGHSSNLTTTTFASSTPQSNQTTPVIYENKNNITIPENNVTVVTNQVNHTRFNDPAEVTDLTFLTQMMSAIQDNPWTIAAVGTLVAAGIAGLSWFGLKNRNEERQDNRLIVTYSKMSFEESLMLIK